MAIYGPYINQLPIFIEGLPKDSGTKQQQTIPFNSSGHHHILSKQNFFQTCEATRYSNLILWCLNDSCTAERCARAQTWAATHRINKTLNQVYQHLQFKVTKWLRVLISNYDSIRLDTRFNYIQVRTFLNLQVIMPFSRTWQTNDNW